MTLTTFPTVLSPVLTHSPPHRTLKSFSGGNCPLSIHLMDFFLQEGLMAPAEGLPPHLDSFVMEFLSCTSCHTFLSTHVYDMLILCLPFPSTRSCHMRVNLSLASLGSRHLSCFPHDYAESNPFPSQTSGPSAARSEPSSIRPFQWHPTFPQLLIYLFASSFIHFSISLSYW